MEVDDLEFEEEEPSLSPLSINQRKRTKRATVPYKSKIRNLKQYASMTDEEFEEMFAKKEIGILPDKYWEERIDKKLKEFGEDYDLTDLKINDKYDLRALAAAVLHLEDYDMIVNKINADGISDGNIYILNQVSKIQTDLRSDIAKIQDSLKISRKSRRSEKQEDAVSALEEIKAKAKKFYEQRMMYIFCPKCNELLATMWFQYPQFKTNKIKLQCHRSIDGVVCDGEVEITSAWLLENGLRNKKDIPAEMC
jgi:hypothetical protein